MRRAGLSASAELLMCFTVGLDKKYFVHNAHVAHSYRLRFNCEGTAWYMPYDHNIF